MKTNNNELCFLKTLGKSFLNQHEPVYSLNIYYVVFKSEYKFRTTEKTAILDLKNTTKNILHFLKSFLQI